MRWADPHFRERNGALHLAGRALLERIGQESKEGSLPEPIRSVEPVRGKQHMDVVCHINSGDDDHTAILVEDKIDTVERGDQMRRYRELIGKKLPDDRILSVYLKTGDQSHTSLSAIEKRGNAVLLRKDLLNMLEGRSEARAASDILDDFVTSLRRREDQVQSWATESPETWGWHAWEGFYGALEEHIKNDVKNADWDYVANPSGGFLAFYAGFLDRGEVEVYIQIEGGDSTDANGVRDGKLVFRIACGDAVPRERYRELRAYWHRQITDRGLPHVERPIRFGFGGTMAVAFVARKHWQAHGKDGSLDLDRTVANVRNCFTALETCGPRENTRT